MSDDRGFQSYIEPLASMLTAPDADYGGTGAAGLLLRQLTGSSGDKPLAQRIPTGWELGNTAPDRGYFGYQERKNNWASDLPGIYDGAVAPNPTINPATGLQQFNLKDAQMSGMQGGPMPPPMQQGAPQGGPPPMAGGAPQQQIPPQVLAMLQQRMAQQGGMPGGGGPMPGGPPGGPGPMPPQGGPPGAGPAPMGQPQQGAAPPQGQRPMTPQQMAQQGRFGDSVVAHLTPGEVEVPPQVQTPQLMHMLQQAFAKAGVSPEQFTAGSPQSSHNPATGAPEYSLLAALLPILGGVGGAAIGGPVGGAIGGALGGGLGGMADKGGTANVLASAAGGGLGGYLGGGGMSGGEAATPFSASGGGNAPFGNGLSAMANPELNTSAAATLAPAQAAAAGAAGGGGSSYLSMLKPGLGAGLGASVGSMVAPPQMPGGANGALPPGFTQGLPPLNPNFNQMLGNGQSSRVSGNGYNPYAAATGKPYNFYSPTGNGQ